MRVLLQLLVQAFPGRTLKFNNIPDLKFSANLLILGAISSCPFLYSVTIVKLNQRQFNHHNSHRTFTDNRVIFGISDLVWYLLLLNLSLLLIGHSLFAPHSH